MNADKDRSSRGNPPASEDVCDPLTEAKELRAALAEVGRRLSRLFASSRQFQKQRRAFHRAWTSLKQLRLPAQEES
jgi:hypothetical protein